MSQRAYRWRWWGSGSGGWDGGGAQRDGSAVRDTFHQFLELLVAQHHGRKVFLILDNGPCHWLDDAGKAWLAENGDKVELHRLPPYSPEFNPMEGVWKTTKRVTTHNRFFRTTQERDDALRATFGMFRAQPTLIAGQVARYLADDRLTP